jgi:hypothetical protein
LNSFFESIPRKTNTFDYKNRTIATREKRQIGSQTSREYVSGFANSDRGVLIIGVNEDTPRAIAPCEPNIGEQPLAEWAGRCFQEMTGYFSPLPRCQMIEHSKGPVLTIAVARAPSLVPCVESRSLKYFFRIGDFTIPIPDFLIADLVLGRRQRPLLELHSPQFHESSEDIVVQENPALRVRSAQFSCTMENLSLTTAEDVKIGLVSWSVVDGSSDEINIHLHTSSRIP